MTVFIDPAVLKHRAFNIFVFVVFAVIMQINSQATWMAAKFFLAPWIQPVQDFLCYVLLSYTLFTLGIWAFGARFGMLWANGGLLWMMHLTVQHITLLMWCVLWSWVAAGMYLEVYCTKHVARTVTAFYYDFVFSIVYKIITLFGGLGWVFYYWTKVWQWTSCLKDCWNYDPDFNVVTKVLFLKEHRYFDACNRASIWFNAKNIEDYCIFYCLAMWFVLLLLPAAAWHRLFVKKAADDAPEQGAVQLNPGAMAALAAVRRARN